MLIPFPISIQVSLFSCPALWPLHETTYQISFFSIWPLPPWHVSPSMHFLSFCPATQKLRTFLCPCTTLCKTIICCILRGFAFSILCLFLTVFWKLSPLCCICPFVSHRLWCLQGRKHSSSLGWCARVSGCHWQPAIAIIGKVLIHPFRSERQQPTCSTGGTESL